MAIITTQKNPIDLNRNQAVGLAFPLSHDNGGFNQSFTVKEAVKNNIISVLLTEKGERVNQPDLGVGLKSLLFENIVDPTILIPMIEDQLDKYVPDAQVIDIQSDFIADHHVLKITLSYSILGSAELDAIELNVDGDASAPVDIDFRKSAGGYGDPDHHKNRYW